MSASKVFFTDFRCRLGVSQLDKLRKLLEKSEFSKIDFDGKFVAIKLHFGELGNLSFLRANYAKVVADFVKERGGNLSQGQKQLLTIARAILADNRILILDEATSALDSGTEEGINRSIAELSQHNRDLTIVVIAHRESSLEYCDRIITLDNNG